MDVLWVMSCRFIDWKAPTTYQHSSSLIMHAFPLSPLLSLLVPIVIADPILILVLYVACTINRGIKKK